MAAFTGPGLHAPTLLLSIAMFGFIMAGIALGDSSALPAQRRALRLWARSTLGVGLACLLSYQRNYAPWWITFGLANLGLLALPAYSLLAHAQLLQQRVSKPALRVLIGLPVAALLANMVFGLSARVALTCLSASFSLMQAWVCWLLWRDFQRRGLTCALAGALIAAPIAMAFALRAMRVAIGDAGPLAPTDASSLQISVLVIGLVHVVSTSMMFFSLVHASQREALLEAFRRDGLTGVYSRHAFFEMACERLEAHDALPHAVLMVDLDRFKQINDTYGHGGGDAALVHAARTMGLALRSTDLLGRYGGEEFCLLISDSTPETALQLGQRLVDGARKQRVRLPDGREVRYTVSAGSAMVDPAERNPEEALREAIERADAAMYAAKQAGRDRAVASQVGLSGPGRTPVLCATDEALKAPADPIASR